MSYTTRQVQGLLTKPELALFQASRANAVKELSGRQLVSKIMRTRELRDKYRDLYQRQTVRTQTGPAKERKVMGGENTRTDVKADVMQEVLSRFEAQHAKLEAQEDRKKVPAKKNARGAAAGNRGTGGADMAMRGVKGTTPRQLARSKRAAEDVALAVVEARAAGAPRAAAKTPAKKAATKTAATKKAASKTAAKTTTTAAKKSSAKAGVGKSVQSLVKAVRKAVDKKNNAVDANGSPTGGKKRGGKTLVSGGVNDLAQGAVPTSMPAVAARKNPLKEEPVNMKIHASARSRKRAHEAKRDSR